MTPDEIGKHVGRAAWVAVAMVFCFALATAVAVAVGGVVMWLLPSPDTTLQQLAEMVLRARVAHIVAYVVFGAIFVWSVSEHLAIMRAVAKIEAVEADAGSRNDPAGSDTLSHCHFPYSKHDTPRV